jgi:hypothetical protein
MAFGCGHAAATGAATDASGAGSGDAADTGLVAEAGAAQADSPLEDTGTGSDAADMDAGTCAAGGDYFVEVRIGDGGTQALEAGCVLCGGPGAGSWSVPSGGLNFGHLFAYVTGCASQAARSRSICINAQAQMPASTGSKVIYHDGDGGIFTSTNGDLQVTAWTDPNGQLGGTIGGQYSATVVAQDDSGATLQLSGAFRVCHAYDWPLPP